MQDSLLGDVTVTAYNAAGEPVGDKQTKLVAGADNANYVLMVEAENGEPLRVEFTNLPAGMADSFNASQTSVQFTKVGGGAVNLGVFAPERYNPLVSESGANPSLATAIMVAGARDNVHVKDEPVVVGTKWNVAQNASTTQQNQDVDFSDRVVWATYSQVGSVYSLVTDNATNSVYAAATYKRISDLGRVC